MKVSNPLLSDPIRVRTTFLSESYNNDVNQDLGRTFRPPLWRWRKMAALPHSAAILDDLICGTGNEVIQDGGRMREGRHFPPPPQWGSKSSPYTTRSVHLFFFLTLIKYPSSNETDTLRPRYNSCHFKHISNVIFINDIRFILTQTPLESI